MQLVKEQGTSKRTWEPMTLEHIGSVAELVLSATSGSRNDGPNNVPCTPITRRTGGGPAC